MRLVLALVVVAGCIPQPEPSPDPGYDYPDSGWTGSGGDPFAGCRRDSECGSQVCARDGACYPAASIRAVHVTWTIGGEVASVASCASHPDLAIYFATPGGGSFGYAPVPCKNGRFTVDKIATSYARVDLMVEGADRGSTGAIESTGDAAIDLP